MNAAAMKKYASEFARMGGLSKSPARAKASRKNGKLGGRPKTTAKPAETTEEKSG